MSLNNTSWPRAVFYLVNGVLLAGLSLAWADGSAAELVGGFGPALIALSRLVALVGAYLILLQLVLISRAPWLESVYGFDRLTRIHRVNGFTAFSLVTLHVFLVITGSALVRGVSLPVQLGIFLDQFAFIGLALLAYILLLVTIGLSVTIVRRRLKYETWHLVHLANYAVLLLALWHQITHGQTLVGNDALRIVWYGLHLGVFLNLILFRFVWPVWLLLRHRFKVSKVVEETADVYSIYITGQNLERFDYRSGQFGKWRFLTRELWSEEHPFTLSSAANGRYLRITPKSVGDFTRELSSVKKGTKVVLSGPLGGFTLERAKNNKVLLIAGGIGITPIRAMIESAGRTQDLTLLYTAKTMAGMALAGELETLMTGNHRRLYYLTTRERDLEGKPNRISREALEELVPDVLGREIFICGPPSLVRSVLAWLKELGVPRSRIHTERFWL